MGRRTQLDLFPSRNLSVGPCLDVFQRFSGRAIQAVNRSAAADIFRGGVFNLAHQSPVASIGLLMRDQEILSLATTAFQRAVRRCNSFPVHVRYSLMVKEIRIPLSED